MTTPLGQAIGNLFARALPLLNGNPPGSLKVFIFGGCAVHLLTHARGSADIDAEIEAARVLRKEEIMAVYTPPEGYEDSDEVPRLAGVLGSELHQCPRAIARGLP
ncbi:hypothetical protein P7I89_06060 [Pseudomonas aeruginosa]|nr:hypothetical protein P7I89_06060 [Pseudomonas aeruginosa]